MVRAPVSDERIRRDDLSPLVYAGSIFFREPLAELPGQLGGRTIGCQ